MKVNLAYGQGWLPVEFPDGRTTVIQPSHTAGLPDERAAVERALEQPVGARPLRELIARDTKLCILFTDITRATPNDRIIPWLLEHLDGAVPRENITLLNQLGTHRPNTKAELEKMLTPAVVANYRVLNHEPENDDALVQVGVTHDGTPALLNRHAV
jgi:lactate racemase